MAATGLYMRRAFYKKALYQTRQNGRKTHYTTNSTVQDLILNGALILFKGKVFYNVIQVFSFGFLFKTGENKQIMNIVFNYAADLRIIRTSVR